MLNMKEGKVLKTWWKEKRKDWCYVFPLMRGRITCVAQRGECSTVRPNRWFYRWAVVVQLARVSTTKITLLFLHMKRFLLFWCFFYPGKSWFESQAATSLDWNHSYELMPSAAETWLQAFLLMLSLSSTDETSELHRAHLDVFLPKSHSLRITRQCVVVVYV